MKQSVDGLIHIRKEVGYLYRTRSIIGHVYLHIQCLFVTILVLILAAE